MISEAGVVIISSKVVTSHVKFNTEKGKFEEVSVNRNTVNRIVSQRLRLASITLLLLCALSNKQPASAESASIEAQRDFNSGVAAFQRTNYRQAVEYFKSALTKDPACSSNCLRRLYLGHSYAGLKELGMAIKTYHEIESNCFGSPEAKLATQCIEKLSNPATARELSEKSPSKGPSLINRIKVLPVLADLPAINPSFIAMVKTTVSRIRPDFYQMLDKSGCTVTIAQNIVYKWVNAYNVSKPGFEYIKLSQDFAFSQGLDVYVWERPIYIGRVLGEPFPIDLCEFYLKVQLYRVACHTMNLEDDKDYLLEYKKDLDKLTKEQQNTALARFFIDQKADGPSQMLGCAVEHFVEKDLDLEVEKMFPNSFAWIKKRLKL